PETIQGQETGYYAKGTWEHLPHFETTGLFSSKIIERGTI
ncbi:unnamed protein product, partial [marine sediment metagenome]